MTDEKEYIKFTNTVCEMLGFNKPIDILKLCQITSDFIRPYEMKIKELEEENERLQEMMITYNEKIDDLRIINKKLKTKLENTERKIREISQKCYEVENIESIISDLDNLAMELEEWQIYSWKNTLIKRIIFFTRLIQH